MYLRLDLCFVKVINVSNRGVHYSISVPIVYSIQQNVSALAQARVDDRCQNSGAHLVDFGSRVKQTIGICVLTPY